MYYCATCHQSETLSATVAARQDPDGGWEITSDAEDQITFCDHCNQDDPETYYKEGEDND